MGRQIPQLTRFIDQAGLFLAFCPITNKLHFASLPGWFVCLDASWNSKRGNSTAEWGLHGRPPHPEEPALAGVSKDGCVSWFETRQRVRAKRGPMMNSAAAPHHEGAGGGSPLNHEFEGIA